MLNYKQKQPLYKISISTGKTQIWRGWADGAEVTVEYGQLGGKQQTSVYLAEGKNLGRVNETSDSEQAVVELEALYVDQSTNKHYRESEGDAIVLSKENRVPRKITNYKDRYGKMSENLLTSLKLNGSRGCVLEGNFYSKIGRPEEIKVEQLKAAIDKLGTLATFDAEIYAHGLSLQRIRSAWLKPVKTDKEIIKVAKDRIKKVNDVDPKTINYPEDAISYLGYNPNEDAPKLKFYVFDIPDNTGTPFEERVAGMVRFEGLCTDKGLEDCFGMLYPVPTGSHKMRMEMLEKVCKQGYEGLVHYEPEGVYEFGKRSTNTAKSKPRYDSECRVLDVTNDKKGEGVLHCVAANSLDNVKFKCKMKVSRRDGKKYPRDYETMTQLKGKWVTFSYEELSGAGIPTKPVGEEERACDNEGNPLS